MNLNVSTRDILSRPQLVSAVLALRCKGNCGPALALLGGLAILYVPTYWRLVTGPWRDGVYAHGPIVLLIVVWLLWQKRRAFRLLCTRQMPDGVAVFITGLMAYIVGRSQDILLLEVGSQIPVLAGLLMMFAGKATLRALWFPLSFLVFLVPVPSFVVDTLTGPLKQMVSAVVENLLYLGGYPIARNGAVLSVGPYRLLVADACSGLNSTYALCAMTTLFIYLRKRTGMVHNLILVASVVPVALVTNIARVCALVLITYYFGDAAGQGFLHDFAGLLEFVVALLVLIGTDSMLAAGIRTNKVAHL